MQTFNIENQKISIVKLINLSERKDGKQKHVSIAGLDVHTFWMYDFSMLLNKGEKLCEEIQKYVPADGNMYAVVIATEPGDGEVYKNSVVSTRSSKITFPRVRIFNAVSTAKNEEALHFFISGGDRVSSPSPIQYHVKYEAGKWY